MHTATDAKDRSIRSDARFLRDYTRLWDVVHAKWMPVVMRIMVLGCCIALGGCYGDGGMLPNRLGCGGDGGY